MTTRVSFYVRGTCKEVRIFARRKERLNLLSAFPVVVRLFTDLRALPVKRSKCFNGNYESSVLKGRMGFQVSDFPTAIKNIYDRIFNDTHPWSYAVLPTFLHDVSITDFRDDDNRPSIIAKIAAKATVARRTTMRGTRIHYQNRAFV